VHVQQLRFDGRVAIVTGAGGNPGLGRAHALLLAERGAKVVVNDLGVGPDGSGALRANAEAIVEEILAAGGEAVADTNSVAERDTAHAIVRTALDAWGRVDILVNNAGIQLLAPFGEIRDDDIRRIIDVHLMGNIWMCRAVWPHMVEARYGRIVNISSGAMFGFDKCVTYGAAKAGILGLMRGLALEGEPYGIRVNALVPGAVTVATTHLCEDTEFVRSGHERVPPELVSPVVAYLGHEDCELSGVFLRAGGGNVREHVFAETVGYANRALTIEDVRDNIATIRDQEGMTITPDIPPYPEGALVAKPYKPVVG
jgi:NAD(P)-dependent dehydrogenase (short-subunit alcohol dehydrogenase family)